MSRILERVRHAIAIVRGAVVAPFVPRRGRLRLVRGGVTELVPDLPEGGSSDEGASDANSVSQEFGASCVPAIGPVRRRGPRAQFTAAQTHELARKLRALPPIDRRARRLKKQATINRLNEAIATFQEQGYTLEQIAGFFTNPGPPTNTPNLDGRPLASGGLVEGRGSKSELPLVLRGRRDLTSSAARPIDEPTGPDPDDRDDDPFGTPHET